MSILSSATSALAKIASVISGIWAVVVQFAKAQRDEKLNEQAETKRTDLRAAIAAAKAKKETTDEGT